MSENIPMRYASNYTLVKAHDGDAAYDLYVDETVVLEPMERKLVDTTLVLEQTPGIAALVINRSGYPLKTGVTVLNAPGLVDSGYRDQVRVSLINFDKEPATVEKGTRIAQLLFHKVLDVSLEKVDHDEIDDGHDARGIGGFGSSGIH